MVEHGLHGSSRDGMASGKYIIDHALSLVPPTAYMVVIFQAKYIQERMEIPRFRKAFRFRYSRSNGQVYNRVSSRFDE